MSDVPLKDYLEHKLAAIDRYYDAQLRSIAERTNEAKEQIEKRLEGMNEFRDTLRDQAGRLATKEQVDVQVTSLDERIKLLELRDAKVAGMAAIVSLVVSVVAWLLVRLV